MIIHVLRKPLDGTVAANALAHGAGALNIDECRVSLFPDEDPDKLRARSGGSRGFAKDDYVGGTLRSMPAGWDCSKGRWPANLVLTHLQSCVCSGVKKVKSQNPAFASVGKGGTCAEHMVFGMSARPQGKGIGYADADGTETVADWQCDDRCPVHRLDEQVGVLTSGKPGIKRTGNTGFAYGTESRPPGSLMSGFGDSGGASRFFQQVTTE
jgi:site-specific DNA-methyltransferase (adenine-specific)